MTTFPLNSSIESPTVFRSMTNSGSGAVGRGLIAKLTTTDKDTFDVATATTDTFAGITTEDVAVGATKSIQKSERCPVIVGASVAIGDKLTTDGQGRAVPTTAAGKSVIGTAATAQTTVGQPCDCDIAIGRFIVAT